MYRIRKVSSIWRHLDVFNLPRPERFQGFESNFLRRLARFKRKCIGFLMFVVRCSYRLPVTIKAQLWNMKHGWMQISLQFMFHRFVCGKEPAYDPLAFLSHLMYRFNNEFPSQALCTLLIWKWQIILSWRLILVGLSYFVFYTNFCSCIRVLVLLQKTFH